MSTYFRIATYAMLGLVIPMQLSYGDDSRALVERQFRPLVTLTQMILAHCPPPKCQIIGLGRSPVPVLVLLEELGHTPLHLPFSGFGWEFLGGKLPGIDPFARRGFSKDSFAPLVSDYLMQHFARHISQQAESVLIIDYAAHGRTAQNLSPSFHHFFNRIGLQWSYGLFSGREDVASTLNQRGTSAVQFPISEGLAVAFQSSEFKNDSSFTASANTVDDVLRNRWSNRKFSYANLRSHARSELHEIRSSPNRATVVAQTCLNFFRKLDPHK